MAARCLALLACVACVACVARVACSPAAPRCARDQHCKHTGSAVDEHFYDIGANVTIKLTIEYSEGQYFNLQCRDDLPLDSPAWPALPRAAPVASVRLTACAPPAAGYARALRRLNVSLDGALQLRALPARPALAPAHLADLPLTALELAPAAAAPLSLHAELFAALPALRDLRLRNVTLPAAPLRLPPALRSLALQRAGGPADWWVSALPGLPRLERLLLTDAELRALDLNGTALREVSVSAPLLELTLGARVERLDLSGVRGVRLLGECAALRSVRLQAAREALPARWLARCPGVRELRVFASRGALGGDELRGARALRVLEARRCGLRDLPPRWLADVVELRALNLSDNLLERLPNLVANKALEEVRVARNRLSADALAPLGELPALRTLALDYNPTLRELCGAGGDLVTSVRSPLARALGLRELSVRGVGLAGVCLDWRVDLRRLAALDLRDNNITSLTLADLQWRRAAPAAVDLRGNAARVDYKQADYDTALAAPPNDTPLTALRLDGAAPCDCHDYWFARAWRERPRHAPVALRGLRCRTPAGNADLSDVPLDELLCDFPESKGCPRGCLCRASPVGSELRCERAGLAAVPRLPSDAPPPRALLLRGNHVTRLRAADLPPALRLLDLRDNRLRALEPAAAAALPPRLLLAGNPLDCSCAALPALRALAAAPARLLDAREARCAGGRLLAEAAARAAAECGAWPLWPAALGALALAALSAGAAAALTRPAARRALKRFLFERGLCLRWALGAREAAEAREFDAFVSFSHRDRRYADALAARLERGGRRLCLHERDWRPGDWIPAQIARSVRAARRTLVLLSEHFLRSAWARAEMREAYAAALHERRPRLLLVLLPGFAPERAAAADAALRAYMQRVTYLRWDDPHFWRKLELALPPPGAPRVPAAAAPAACDAPPQPPPPP